MVARLSPNKRAMTVKVDEVSGVAGFLSPNDRVDVVVTISPKEASKDLVAKVVLQNLRVLSTGQKIERLPGEKPMVVPTVTLEVTPEEAERLALSTREGQISLGLRGLKDQPAVATPGVTTLQLLGGETEDSSTSPRHQVEVLRRLERESLRF
jgi:pilus assembly protein CpaB